MKFYCKFDHYQPLKWTKPFHFKNWQQQNPNISSIAFSSNFQPKKVFCQDLNCTNQVLMASTYTPTHGPRATSPCPSSTTGVLVSSSGTARLSLAIGLTEPGSTYGLMSQPGLITTNLPRNLGFWLNSANVLDLSWQPHYLPQLPVPWEQLALTVP